SLKSIERVLVSTPLRWLLLYGVFAVCSAAWSNQQTLTLFRGGQFLIYLILVADAVSSARSPQDMLRLQLLYALGVVLAWQLAIFVMDPSLEALHKSDVPGTIIGACIAGLL